MRRRAVRIAAATEEAELAAAEEAARLEEEAKAEAARVARRAAAKAAKEAKERAENAAGMVSVASLGGRLGRSWAGNHRRNQAEIARAEAEAAAEAKAAEEHAAMEAKRIADEEAAAAAAAVAAATDLARRRGEDCAPLTLSCEQQDALRGVVPTEELAELLAEATTLVDIYEFVTREALAAAGIQDVDAASRALGVLFFETHARGSMPAGPQTLASSTNAGLAAASALIDQRSSPYGYSPRHQQRDPRGRHTAYG